MRAFHLFAEEHGGSFPTDFTQAFAKNRDNLYIEGMSPNKVQISFGGHLYEIVYAGKLSDLTEPNNVIVIRQVTPHHDSAGRPTKAYGFADGHSEVYSPPDGNFERWEKARMASNAAK